ncbi:MAG: hypothetical protein WCG27_11490, partial [Pseudomonadota bacterium]
MTLALMKSTLCLLLFFLITHDLCAADNHYPTQLKSAEITLQADGGLKIEGTLFIADHYPQLAAEQTHQREPIPASIRVFMGTPAFLNPNPDLILYTRSIRSLAQINFGPTTQPGLRKLAATILPADILKIFSGYDARSELPFLVLKIEFSAGHASSHQVVVPNFGKIVSSQKSGHAWQINPAK